MIFEGRDAAGKGGTIKAITERVSPRVFRVVALPAPSDREKTMIYFQRYIQHFLAAGEIVIFDRSWYNRAGVEHVMGFCSKKEYQRFLDLTPVVEKYLVDGGIQLVKFWLEVSDEEQNAASKLAAAGIRTQVVEARASVRDTLRAEGLEEKLGNINRLSSIVDVVDDFEKQGLSKEGAAEDNAKSKA